MPLQFLLAFIVERPMSFYLNAANRILQFNAEDCAPSAELQRAHTWLMAQQKAWSDLEARMKEKGCGVPKMLSEDTKREQIEECLGLMERGEPQTGATALSALIEANPEKPKLRGWYKNPQINTFEDSEALYKARTRPDRIVIR